MQISGYSGISNPGLSTIIANTAQESAVINTGGMTLCGLYIPAAFTGTTLTFEACQTSGGTFVPVKNASGAVSYTVAPGEYLAVDPKDFQGIQYLKFKSGTAEGADRTVGFALKGI